ncbi:aldo/keto reductase [Roseateles sp. SL47]|uniref:aldo/keto reductase n=1 Tax=Roseateles sp. SL47 TaxID=2995138 RepID=UPI00226EE2A1|nr:aldo/keto reductase [Roseateles sp. SL47]WAC70910.1 aldo/keto reductase [Roseateles sp. SL47]
MNPQMRYSQLGRTGLFVSRFCLGGMTFGGADTPAGAAIGRLSQEETQTIVSQALDAGINFIDTADVYGGGGSETVLGEALKLRRNEVVLATKLHARVGPGPNDVGQSRLHIMTALEQSLRRLQTDRIDLYQIHGFDPITPMEEVLRALDDAVRSGKVRYVGCSNLAAWQLMKAIGVAERDRLTRFASLQAYYSLAGRDIEHELVPAVTDAQVGLLCWSPLAGGLLSGKFDRQGSSDTTARRALIAFPPVDETRVYDIIDALKVVALRHSTTPAQVALAWLLARPAVTSVIIGIKRPEQLADNLGALDLVLAEEDHALLDEVSRPTAAYPGWIQTYNARSRYPAGHPFQGSSWSLGERPL